MRGPAAAYALLACLAAALVVQSCASMGGRPEPLPCDDAHLSLVPLAAGSGWLELTGRIRIELPRYRFRGLCRIVHAPDGRMRIDFEHSSLFGALRGRLTVLSGDSLVIYDFEEGRYYGGADALAVVEDGLGARIMPDDPGYALLLVAPRCFDMADPVLERRRGGLELRGSWRGRDISIGFEEGKGPRVFKQCFRSPPRCFIMQYDSYVQAGSRRYPRSVRLSREGGPERISLDIIEIKSVMPDPAAFVIGG